MYAQERINIFYMITFAKPEKVIETFSILLKVLQRNRTNRKGFIRGIGSSNSGVEKSHE
jgi:hypothetical protein